jgi:hypothetical protein
MFANILDSAVLRKLVRRVDVYTRNPDCVSPKFSPLDDPPNRRGRVPVPVQTHIQHLIHLQNHDPSWTKGSYGPRIYSNDMPRFALTRAWWTCFSRIPELENLRGVAVIFDRHGGSDGGDDDADILQDRGVRAEWLWRVFELLGDRLELKELAGRNFQDYGGDEDGVRDGEDGRWTSCGVSLWEVTGTMFSFC